MDELSQRVRAARVSHSREWPLEEEIKALKAQVVDLAAGLEAALVEARADAKAGWAQAELAAGLESAQRHEKQRAVEGRERLRRTVEAVCDWDPDAAVLDRMFAGLLPADLEPWGESSVNRASPTAQELEGAIKRADRNSAYWPKWDDPRRGSTANDG